MSPVLHAFLSQTAPGGSSPQNFLGSPLVMMALIGVVFYLFLIRPQQKQAKQHREFLGALKKGDEVVTQGGIVGTIVLVEDRTVSLDVGSGTKLRVVKGNVAGAWKAAEAQPVKAEAKK